MKCSGEFDVRDIDECCINIDPIQAGGRLTADAMKAVIAYGDGYSVCDQCRKPFRLDYIKKPPIDRFHRDLAAFVNMDVARVVPGARRGFQAVADTYIRTGDPVLITALSHYTEVLAIEGRGGVIREIPKSEGNIITADAAADTIEQVAREFGRPPVLLFLDHYDYQYGNRHPVGEIAKIARQYDIPVLYNGAYTVGIMQVDGKGLGVDFVVGSGHKSMAAPAPSGMLAATSERASEVFRTTGIRTDVTGRTFGIKEVGLMGCTLMGVTLMGMLASFPHVRERVKRWDQELANGNLVVEALRSIEGTVIKSEYPRKHTLTRVDTINSFDRVAKTHKKRGYFFSSALKERGVAGIIPGATRVWKYNTYGMTRTQAEYLATTFQEIAEENDLPVNR
ncbi:MAG TPA: O-phospho-L-seryl-tRNA:Cys-tRNA synthase [Methanoregulaceae archaeon]|nr:MAG: O-phospho-L-seryl-tRNA:Cys-tRNA synthase [Methanolinea sp.]HON81466.1 O-phospho-L-seryl-tRNA:Cys-tRNA synthase [Methanoregulaceae archaeon]HPD10006.1 O-phospho-L-seryl-tRNA:Cys-tRNA synthase [Methanoregulaceae archaeon]HRT15012.1 O-phospho-L-seryl-tRNA:Cys-tRNA synthase [Methanoregulaceae archaeon]HRU30583.1 O-phospho-L-seryl-tRNA:Cys-tRNA synthase [Methanoregulaceae archaeon]